MELAVGEGEHFGEGRTGVLVTAGKDDIALAVGFLEEAHEDRGHDRGQIIFGDLGQALLAVPGVRIELALGEHEHFVLAVAVDIRDFGAEAFVLEHLAADLAGGAFFALIAQGGVQVGSAGAHIAVRFVHHEGAVGGGRAACRSGGGHVGTAEHFDVHAVGHVLQAADKGVHGAGGGLLPHLAVGGKGAYVKACLVAHHRDAAPHDVVGGVFLGHGSGSRP